MDHSSSLRQTSDYVRLAQIRLDQSERPGAANAPGAAQRKQACRLRCSAMKAQTEAPDLTGRQGLQLENVQNSYWQETRFAISDIQERGHEPIP
jgi:hypothetical protein